MERQIFGQTDNLNKRIMERLEYLADLKSPKTQIASAEIVEVMSKITREIKKEIAIYLDRSGQIVMVSVGSDSTAPLLEMSKKRKDWGLTALRAVHTHPNGDCRLSAPDLSALSNLRLDLMCAIGVGEKNVSFSVAVLNVRDGELVREARVWQNLSREQFYQINPILLAGEIEKDLNSQILHKVSQEEERVITVLVLPNRLDAQEETERREELKNLAESAGLKVVGELIQHKDKPDGVFCLGKGKLEELAMLAQNTDASCIIFDNGLSPAQENNLNRFLGKKVIDKNTLILDIFAARAKTREGQLQVEAAQLNYLLPRLIGQGVSMSRLGGGVGTRGPGETKLETDRRHIRRRLDNVRRELNEVRKQRQIQRQKRKKQQIPLVALVGYTNAGKSSLLNALTGADIYAQDQLFATLDPTVRVLRLEQREVLLSDTVGFIRDLPEDLVEAFEATLEELKEADLLLHVVDAKGENYQTQIKSVEKILKQVGVLDKPSIYVFNKIDALEEIPPFGVEGEYICVSAKEGIGLEELKRIILHKIFGTKKKYKIFLPFAEAGLMSKFYNLGQVEEIDYTEEGTVFTLISEEDVPEKLKKYITEEIL